MAVFELEAGATYYKGGSVVTSRVVGYESQANRVARYSFTAPAEGANHIEIIFYSNGLAGGSQIPVWFFIGTDPDSHANAGAGSEYTGELTLASDGETFTWSGDILLLPNTTYYIWFFPGKASYGYYSWYGSGTSTLTTSGGAGLIFVGNGTSCDAYQIYVGNGTGYDLYPPYIGNGSTYDLFTGQAKG